MSHGMLINPHYRHVKEKEVEENLDIMCGERRVDGVL